MVARWEECRGCNLCMMACSRHHFGKVNPELSAIKVYQFYPGPMSIPVTCSYCLDRPCVEACPCDALYYDAENALLRVNREECLGVDCSACALACQEKRSGAIHFYPPEYDFAIVCDQCDGAPQCVTFCPFDCLDYQSGMLAEHQADPASRIAEDMAERWYPATSAQRASYNI